MSDLPKLTLSLSTLGQFTGRDTARYRLIIEDPAPSLMEATRQSVQRWEEWAEVVLPPTTGDMISQVHRSNNLGADFTLPELPPMEPCGTCQGTSFVYSGNWQPIDSDHIPAVPWELPGGIVCCEDCNNGESRTLVKIGPATFASDKLRPLIALMPLPACRLHYIADLKAHMLTASGVIDGTRILCALMSLGAR